nr:glycosyltransferase family 39 protein [Acidimicrobiia bacterium]
PLGRVVAGLVALTALAVVFRLEGRGMSFWLDEGLSVGIASHPLTDIPGLLRQDGSPPLYYLLLHLWMLVFGTSEEAVRALSLALALVIIPVAFWSADGLFGRRAAWGAAVLTATSSYLVYYSREARMYTLLVLLVLVCVTAFTHAFVFGRRRWLPVVALSLTGALYTHNWGLYLALGLAAAAGLAVVATTDRRRLLLDGAAVTAAVAVLYAPWVPVLVYQAANTGAPWSRTPDVGNLVGVLGSIVGHDGILIAFALVGLPALVALVRRWRAGGEALAAAALAVVVGVSLALSWLASLLEPAWAGRYFGVFLPPVILLMALGLARERRRGLVALGLIAFLAVEPFSNFPGLLPTGSGQKSNVRRSVLMVDHLAGAGDVVVSTQMEHVPLLHYYLGPDLRYADPMGPVADPQIVDWRDATARMLSATPEQGLVPLVEDMEAGSHLFLVCPRSEGDDDEDEDRLEWVVLMEQHCLSWRATLVDDPSMERVLGPVSPTPRRAAGSSVFITVYEKLA